MAPINMGAPKNDITCRLYGYNNQSKLIKIEVECDVEVKINVGQFSSFYKTH